MIAYLPIAVAVAGLVLYFAAKDSSKWVEVGRICFFTGLLVTLFKVAGESVSFLR